jgi:tellurite methyltransferase
MSSEDRHKWDKRHGECVGRLAEPSEFLKEWLPELPRGKALDVACGRGRNALYLAREKFQVDAIDISPVAIEQARNSALAEGLRVNWIVQDLDSPYDFARDYDLILVMWYLDLPLIGRLCRCLAPGGFLLCEEHLATDRAVAGPRNPAFRVAPGELLQAVAGNAVRYYDESVASDAGGELIARARLVVAGPDMTSP